MYSSKLRHGLAVLALAATVGACGGNVPQSSGPAGTESCTPVSLTGPDGSAIDLSGTWSGNDGGIYYLKQIDNCLWWSGLSNFEGQYPGEAWVMTFKGTITADKVIHGDFVDVKSDNPGSGTMTITIDPQQTDAGVAVFLNRTESTGHEIGVSFWQRLVNEPSSSPTPSAPPASGAPSPSPGTTTEPTPTATAVPSTTASAVPTDASGNPVTLPPG